MKTTMRLAGFLFAFLLSPLYSQEETHEQENQTQTQNIANPQTLGFLLIGPTRNIGYNLAHLLLNQKIQVTLLTWNKAKTKPLFAAYDGLEIIEGLIEKEWEVIKKAATGKNIIFYCPHFPTKEWEKNMPTATRHVIEAAQATGATIIYPSKSHSVGNVDGPITEEMPTQPCSNQGRVLDEIEKMLQKATEDGRCKVIIVRHAHVFGPNVAAGLFNHVFKNAVNKQPLEWVNRIDIGFQMTYAPDVAELMFKLAQLDNLANFSLFNYGGIIANPVESWLKQLAEVAGIPFKTSINGWFKVTALSFFNSAAKACKDIFYTFEKPITLDDTKIRTLFPNFSPTEMKFAIQTTFEWFKHG
jgi:nucleoside-diphosphate-sugar epimerase